MQQLYIDKSYIQFKTVFVLKITRLIMLIVNMLNMLKPNKLTICNSNKIKFKKNNGNKKI